MTMKLDANDLAILSSCGVVAGEIPEEGPNDGASGYGTAADEGGAGYDPRPRQTGLIFDGASTAKGISLAKGDASGIVWGTASNADGIPMRANQLDLVNGPTDEGGAGYDPRPRQTGLVFGTGNDAPGISLAKGTDAGIIWNDGSGASGIPMRGNQLDLINDASGLDWNAGKVGCSGGVPAGGLDILGAAAQSLGLPPQSGSSPYVDDNQLTDPTPLDHEAGLVFGAVFDLEQQTISGYGDASIPDGGIPDTKYDAFFGDVEILEGCGDFEVIGGYSNWWGPASIPDLLKHLAKSGPFMWPGDPPMQVSGGTGEYPMDLGTWLKIHPYSRPDLWNRLTEADRKALLARWPQHTLMTKHPPSKGFFSNLGSAVKTPLRVASKLSKGDFAGAAKAAVLDPFKSTLALGKDVVKSPLVKVGAGALAVAFPPIGVPVAAGLALANTGLGAIDKAKQAASAAGQGISPAAALTIADKMVRVADGQVPGKSPAQVDAMKRALRNTAVLSKQYGNPLQPAAQRAIEQMALALKLQQTRDTQLKKTLGNFSLRRFKKSLNKSTVAKAKAKAKEAASMAASAAAPVAQAATTAITQTGRSIADVEIMGDVEILGDVEIMGDANGVALPPKAKAQIAHLMRLALDVLSAHRANNQQAQLAATQRFQRTRRQFSNNPIVRQRADRLWQKLVRSLNKKKAA